MLTMLDVVGLRGFSTKQTLTFAIPNGIPGSGLTVLVGPNNAGKSTVIEALNAISHQGQSPSFTQGRRNQAAGDLVSIRAIGDQGEITLESVQSGSSETRFQDDGGTRVLNLLILPSRRAFNPYFGRWPSFMLLQSLRDEIISFH